MEALHISPLYAHSGEHLLMGLISSFIEWHTNTKNKQGRRH